MSEHFPTRRLGDLSIAEVVLGQSPPSSAYNDAGNGLPFFQGKADFGLLHPTPRMWCSAGQKFAGPGDVLMSVRAPVGDVNVATARCVIGRGVAAIRAGADVDPWFLYFALLYSKPTLEDRATGSTFASVNKATLHELEIPFAKRSEQAAIGMVLRHVVEKLGQEDFACQAALKLKRGAMTGLFLRGLRGEAQKETEIGLVPESWIVDDLGAHHAVVSGGTPSRGNPAFWTAGTIPWVKTTEVDYCTINDTEEHITPEGLESSAAKLLPVGTLLMAMYGQGVTRGKVAILGIEAACNQACAAITPKTDTVSPRYLYHFLSWQYEAIRALAHGGQQQNLNLEIVRGLPIAYPEAEDEQQEIVTVLDAIDRKIALHQKKRAVLEELFKSLLQKLMAGKIVIADLDFSPFEGVPSEATA
jgi:type I restriction enzyme, S subunit